VYFPQICISSYILLPQADIYRRRVGDIRSGTTKTLLRPDYIGTSAGNAGDIMFRPSKFRRRLVTLLQHMYLFLYILPRLNRGLPRYDRGQLSLLMCLLVEALYIAIDIRAKCQKNHGPPLTAERVSGLALNTSFCVVP